GNIILSAMTKEALSKTDSESSSAAIAAINKLNRSQWAKIWCELNAWGWPQALKEIKPSWWDQTAHADSQHRKFDFTNPIMKYIEYSIGMQACNREWNRDRMTDEEHEAFW